MSKIRDKGGFKSYKENALSCLQKTNKNKTKPNMKIINE